MHTENMLSESVKNQTANKEISLVKVSMAQLEDAALLFDMYRVFYRQPADLARGRQFLADRIQNQESDIFLAYVDGQAVGFVQLYGLFHYIKLEKQLLLSDLFVHPDYRGLGLSVMLIDRAKAFCDEVGACGLMLETEKTNDIGNKLYPRCGFEYDALHNYYYWWK